MKFGMPTLVECNDVLSCAKIAREQGLDFIEINMSFPQYTADRLDIEELRKIAREYGIFYTIHADEALNPFDFNAKVSDCYFSVMRDTVRVAKELECPIINLHLQRGIYVTLPGQRVMLTDVYYEEFESRVVDFIKLCEEEAAGSGVRIAIENVDTNAFTEAQLKVLPRFLSSERFGLTLDTGHEHCLSYKDTPVFRAYPDKLIHMHLHDCKDNAPHMPLGVGDINVKDKLSQLRFADTCLIEVKTIEGLKISTDYLKKQNII